MVDRAELVDLAVVRLTAMAAHIEEHAEEGHGRGYRGAAAFVISRRDRWLREELQVA